ncbi:MAG: hypothetical protein NUV54_03625 [Candidatus Taylorbacteria bacterium]|nr:hypothetical protein [Candidatus Taylorbacteria bacterium]
MDSSNSNPNSLTVEIKDVVNYILGDEKITVPLSKLTPAQVVRLFYGYAERVKPYIRHAGKSFEDIEKGLEFKSEDFAMQLPDGVSPKARVVQLSIAYLRCLPNQTPPTKKFSFWLTHSLFVSESGKFVLGSLASKGMGVSTQFKFEILDSAGFLQFIDFYKVDPKELLNVSERMWEQLIARQEERLDRIREQKSSLLLSMMGRIG